MACSLQHQLARGRAQKQGRRAGLGTCCWVTLLVPLQEALRRTELANIKLKKKVDKHLLEEPADQAAVAPAVRAWATCWGPAAAQTGSACPTAGQDGPRRADTACAVLAGLSLNHSPRTKLFVFICFPRTAAAMPW